MSLPAIILEVWFDEPNEENTDCKGIQIVQNGALVWEYSAWDHPQFG